MTQRDKLDALRKSVEAQLIRSGKNPDEILFTYKSRRRSPARQGDMLFKQVSLPNAPALADMSFPKVLPPAKTGDKDLDIASGAVKATQGERLVAQAELRRRTRRTTNMV